MRKKSLTSALFILLVSIVLISTFKTNAFAQTTPKISIVSLEHVPFVEGENNEFYISSKNYTGQVQYQLFYIQESVMKEWKLIDNADMTNGWTNSIDAQTPIVVDISKLNLKADKYRFAIRVRRVGVKGLKQNSYGDYDDAYPFNVDVVKNANIELSGDINIEKTSFTTSENLVINGVGNSKDIQYKLHLFDVKNSNWLINLTEYRTNISYNLEDIPEGTYIIDLWAKNASSNTKYDGWKLKVITIKKVMPISLNKTTSSLILGGEDNLTAIVNTIDSTNKSVTWTSSDDTIAKVDATGKVTALKIGTATITATTFDKVFKATCEVTINSSITDNTVITSKFTDANFKAIVYAEIDKASPEQILYSDVKNIARLTISKGNISSLSGIEYFTALTSLTCNDNQLTTLDVSKITELTYLNCGSNQLTTLDVSKNTELITLYCYRNQITTLDVSKNTELTSLNCYRNQITTLDVSKNIGLTILYCGDNQLTTLDVSNNTPLTSLICSGNQLTTLDVSKNAELTSLNCIDNKLETLNVSENTKLTSLQCFDNKLTTLDVSKNAALTTLECYLNQLTTLDVSKNTSLTRLSCANNKLTTLDVSKNTELTSLNCYRNQLLILDVSKNIALTILYCSDNQLTTLDVSKNTELTSLNCISNQLTTLDVSKNTALTFLNCAINKLTTLDVGENIALTSLNCVFNQLTTLDVSKNTELTSLDCAYNQLTTLYSIKNTWDTKYYSKQYTDSARRTTTNSLIITIKK